MKWLYFEQDDECGDSFDRLSGSAIETIIGAFPMWVLGREVVGGRIGGFPILFWAAGARTANSGAILI